MNPALLLRLKGDLKAFQTAHPKFSAFLGYAAKEGLQEGDVLDITIRTPEGKTTHANCRITREDAALFRRLQAALHENKNGG